MLQIEGVTKRFGDFCAVDDVTLSFAPGEIVGLVGENGAGKTTLMRIVAGDLAADHGTIQRPERVQLVHQHFMLVGDFTVAENLVLSRGQGFDFLSPRSIRREAAALAGKSGLAIPDRDRRVDSLSVGEKARLELVKALSRDPQVVILDEPTSVLTPLETEELFVVVKTAAAQGMTVIFISHKLPEVLAASTRIVVMRGGRVVADVPASGVLPNELAELMVGSRTVPPIVREPRLQPGRVTLAIREVTAASLRDVSLELRKGEVVAIAGVAGNGQHELTSLLRGLAAPSAGTIEIEGTALTARALRQTHLVAHIPEDRTRDGLVAEMSIAENIGLTAPNWNPRQGKADAARLIERFSIRADGPGQPARELSGGNQQKVLLARELNRSPRLIIASEPTRGLDVAATEFVHAQLRDAAGQGAAILLVTSDLDEAFTLADALHVIYRGSLSRRLTIEEARLQAAALMAGVG